MQIGPATEVINTAAYPGIAIYNHSPGGRLATVPITPHCKTNRLEGGLRFSQKLNVKDTFSYRSKQAL